MALDWERYVVEALTWQERGSLFFFFFGFAHQRVESPVPIFSFEVFVCLVLQPFSLPPPKTNPFF